MTSFETFSNLLPPPSKKKGIFAFGDPGWEGCVGTGNNREQDEKKSQILQSHQLKFSNYHSKCHFIKLIE